MFKCSYDENAAAELTGTLMFRNGRSAIDYYEQERV